MSLPVDDAVSWLISCPLSSLCFSCVFLFVFLFYSETVPGLIWSGSVYLVTTAGFVEDQLMRDKEQQQLPEPNQSDIIGTNMDPNRDKIFARFDHLRTLGTYRCQDNVFEYELRFLLSGALPVFQIVNYKP